MPEPGWRQVRRGHFVGRLERRLDGPGQSLPAPESTLPEPG
jgi:hypothetical protein